MTNKFKFFEVVTINKKHRALKIRNKVAVVTGMSEENNIWYYGLCVYTSETDTDGWTIEEQYLEPTGKFMKREDFYDGSTAKVVVDKKGRSHLKELNLKDKGSGQG